MNLHCFLLIVAYVFLLFYDCYSFKHSGQLDLNAAQNVQAIYNLNFLHREKRTVFIYNINVGWGLEVPTHHTIVHGPRKKIRKLKQITNQYLNGKNRNLHAKNRQRYNLTYTYTYVNACIYPHVYIHTYTYIFLKKETLTNKFHRHYVSFFYRVWKTCFFYTLKHTYTRSYTHTHTLLQ